jgi:NAD(P)-dependent dehydrogenase (short-subunit alcohol dehydrogenase family)
MQRHRSGRIINVSGLAPRQTGSIVGTIRNVSVAALTKNLADELGPHGISVTCVHPGFTRTEKTPDALHYRRRRRDCQLKRSNSAWPTTRPFGTS